MEALVTVAGIALPEPSSYDATTSTLVDSGRNTKGYVIGAVVRNDIAKVSLSWKYLSLEDWAKILSMFNNNFYNDVTFLNQTTGEFETRRMYVGDRTSGMWRRDPQTGKVMGWLGCKLALVEV